MQMQNLMQMQYMNQMQMLQQQQQVQMHMMMSNPYLCNNPYTMGMAHCTPYTGFSQQNSMPYDVNSMHQNMKEHAHQNENQNLPQQKSKQSKSSTRGDTNTSQANVSLRPPRVPSQPSAKKKMEERSEEEDWCFEEPVFEINSANNSISKSDVAEIAMSWYQAGFETGKKAALLEMAEKEKGA